MALQKQLISLSFAQGLDTKSDPKQVVPGKLLELENGVFISPGRIRKRYGLNLWRADIEGGDRFVSGSALSVYGDGLVLFTGEEVYARFDSTSRWGAKGTATSVITKTDQIIRNGYAQSNPDVGYIAGLEVVTWEDARGGIRYTAVDTVTRAIIVPDSLVSPSGEKPRVVSADGALQITFVDGNTIKYRQVDPLTPTLLGAEELVVTDYSTGSVSAVWSDDNENVWTAFLSGSGGTSLYASVFTYALSALVTGTLIENPSGTVMNMTGLSTAESLSSVYYEMSGSTADKQTIRLASLDITNVVSEASGASLLSTSSLWARSVGLASKAWRQGTTHYLWGVHQSTFQPTYFAFNRDARAVSRANGQFAGGLRTNGILSAAPATDTGVYRFAGLAKGRIISEGNTTFSQLGVTSTELDFASPNKFLSVEAAKNLHVVGGVLSSYDGVTFTEHGFSLYPEDIIAEPVAGTGIGAGTYQYVGVYEWPDNKGQVQRSAPSVPITVEVGSGEDVTLTIPTLRITGKDNPRVPVQVALYRTENNGPVFYKVTSPTSPLFNDVGSDTVTFTDTLVDDDLISRELLYTTGDVKANDPPPPCTLIASFKNRIWLAGLEDPNVLWYSKTWSDGEPVGFSAEFTERVDALGGPITALGVLDDRLVVFKRSRIYTVTGEGPNNTGTGQGFLHSSVASDVGCTNPNSVVQTPMGLMFQSTKGIYLLDHGLNVTYIGAPVEAYNDLVIASATLVGDTNQVRFITDTSIALVYDFGRNPNGSMVDQWSTFTNYAGVDSEVWQGKFLLLRRDGQVAEEDRESFSDNGRHVKLKLVTSWLSFAGIQGFSRVRRMHVLGEYKSAHRLRVRFGFNYNTSFAQESIIDAEDVMNLSKFGEDSPFGSGTPFGGEFPLYQFRVQVGEGKQTNTAMRVSLEDLQSDSFDEGLSLSSIAFEVGLKAGGNRLGANRNFGAR